MKRLYTVADYKAIFEQHGNYGYVGVDREGDLIKLPDHPRNLRDVRDVFAIQDVREYSARVGDDFVLGLWNDEQ
jgi:hypothetical protein